MQIKRRYDDRLSLLEHAEHNEAEAAAAVNAAAASRENLLHYYHHYRRRMLSMPMTAPTPGTAGPNQQLIAPATSPAAAMLIAERPIGSTGPPPPLQMILNVPPPPPYSP